MAHPLVVKKQNKHDFYIGNPTVWGNHFVMEDRDDPTERREVILCYALWLKTRPNLIERAREELKGKKLACWCAPLPCHGDILARVAEGMNPIAAFQDLYD